MSYGERIKYAGAPTLSEALQGSLPSIDVLQQALAERLEPLSRHAPSIKESMVFAEEMLNRVHDNSGVGGLKNPPYDVVTILFLDSLLLIGHKQNAENNVYQNARKRISRKDLRTRNKLRGRMQKHLAWFDETFPTHDPNTKNRALDSIIYEATCVLFNQPESTSYTFGSAKDEIRGMLAEYKILKLLRKSGYPWARYGHFEEDTWQETDILVPTGKWRGQGDAIRLQIKAGNMELQIDRTDKGVLLFKVPMNGELDQFNVSPEDGEKILQAVADEAVKLGLA